VYPVREEKIDCSVNVCVSVNSANSKSKFYKMGYTEMDMDHDGSASRAQQKAQEEERQN
jgi:hypothetical protein